MVQTACILVQDICFLALGVCTKAMHQYKVFFLSMTANMANY